MASSTNHIALLQFDAGQLSLLRVRLGGKGVDVASYRVRQLAPATDDAALADAIKALVQEQGASRDTLYTVLPRHELTARILHLPSHDSDEIAGMVRLNAEEYVPFPLDQLVIDQSILQKLPDGHARVLTVFAQRDIVDAHVAVLARVGLEPAEILVSSACAASAAIAARGDTVERYALINLAAGGLEIMVFNGPRLEFTRGIATRQDWSLATNADAAVEELAVEVRASLALYRRESEDSGSVEAIYLCSDWADLTQVAAALANEVDVEVHKARFLKNLASSLEETQGLPLVAVGGALLAQKRAPISVSLVPQSLLDARRQRRFKKQLTAFAASAAILAASLMLVFAVARHQRTAYLVELEAQLADVRVSGLEVRDKQRKLSVLENRVHRGGSALELLSRVSQPAPDEGLAFTRFVYTEGRMIRLEGQARNMAEIDGYIEKLRELRRGNETIFESVVAPTVEQGALFNQPVWRYSIEAAFPQPREDSQEAEDSGDFADE
ncbi:MAG: pilus assembly protein PilM [Candidatus Hydrogenedentes bacterium]|nr:pilus assembly protein PilM [Candidatus Hydrogenedentota bacterium]